jgi:hypothetical protein
MIYGLKVKNASGDELLVTPGIISLYDGGRESMPTSGTNGQTYEKQIDITPDGESAYAEEDIGVLADSFIMNIDLLLQNTSVTGDNASNTWYMQSWFFNNSYNFFTRNESTGILSTWTPNKTSETDYDGLLSVFPSCFWDKRGASTFSNINIFAGTCYLGYDQSASAYKTVYTVGSEGVENVDYVIFLRRYKGE